MTKKHLFFLRDVVFYTLTAFGGPQAHIAILLREFAEKRNYIKAEELMELNALSQILPGPGSTQTLVGIAWKVGGLRLAIITFLIWILPSATLMCVAAITFKMFVSREQFIQIMRFVQPIAIGIVAYAAYTFATKFLRTRMNILMAIVSFILTLILQNAYAFPILIILGGIVSSVWDAPKQEAELKVSLVANLNPKKLGYFVGILLLFAALGAIVNKTSPFSLPIRLFENFYRNGILVFGGGQVLIPLMYTEFVTVKHYLSNTEFISGFALQQALPGPVFSFSSFLGGMAMGNNGYGIVGQIAGSLVAVIGLNLPGLILILFIVPFWDDLRKITSIKNSLNGINSVAVGFMATALIMLASPLAHNYIAIAIMAATFLLLKFTKVKTPLLVVFGVILGIIFK